MLLCLSLWVFAARADALEGRVISVSDGDTVDVLDSQRVTRRVRLGASISRCALVLLPAMLSRYLDNELHAEPNMKRRPVRDSSLSSRHRSIVVRNSE
jgi:hypothetical protein